MLKGLKEPRSVRIDSKLAGTDIKGLLVCGWTPRARECGPDTELLFVLLLLSTKFADCIILLEEISSCIWLGSSAGLCWAHLATGQFRLSPGHLQNNRWMWKMLIIFAVNKQTSLLLLVNGGLCVEQLSSDVCQTRNDWSANCLISYFMAVDCFMQLCTVKYGKPGLAKSELPSRRSLSYKLATAFASWSAASRASYCIKCLLPVMI